MPETYAPIIWHNDTFPAINENNLNRIEVGVDAIDVRAAALERGITAPVTVPYASSVTLNATQGALFRCFASGDLTLDDIVGGVDGQTVVFEIQASGADRVLHFTGSTDTVSIAVGQWWVGQFRFVAASSSWLLDDGSGGGGSSSSGNNLNILAPQTVAYAATVTLNAATGALFRITAPGDLTLASPINGTDGQAIVVEVLASGGQRLVSFAGGAVSPVAIPSGAQWTGTLRYNATQDTWLVTAGGGSGGSVDTATANRVTALEHGTLTPVTVTYASSISLNATQGALFRCVATGDLTLADIIGGTDGQEIDFEVYASGSTRVLSFAGGATPIAIPSGKSWSGTFRYRSSDDTWRFRDGFS